MADLRGFIANCLIGGHTGVAPDGNITWIKLIEWDLQGYNIELYQHKDILTKKPQEYRKQFVHSTHILVKDVKESDVSKVKGLLDDLSALLGFAGLSDVWCYGYEYPDGSGFGQWHTSWGQTNYVRPTIDIRHKERVHHFVKQVWPQYQKLKKKRKLPIIFKYLIQAEPEQYTEMKLLIMFTVLESLKYTYAKERKIPYIKGYFRKISSPPKPNPKKEPPYSFEELLTEMFREQKIRKGLKRIVRLRNDIFHSGLASRPSRSLFKTSRECNELIRIYLLKILGYKGAYNCRTELKNKIIT